jgi:hypothetical protein
MLTRDEARRTGADRARSALYVLHLSRNRGEHHAAGIAGLELAHQRGDAFGHRCRLKMLRFGEIGLSSLEMVNLMLAVEGEFDAKIPDADMTPANFRTVARIEALLDQLLQHA